MLKAICADEPRRYQLDDESGWRDVDCVYVKLFGNGYAAISLGRVDDEDWSCLKFLRDLALPQNSIKNKEDAHCVKVIRIIPNCKWAISSELAKIFFEKEEPDSFNSAYIYREIGDVDAKSGELAPKSIRRAVCFAGESLEKSRIVL